MTVRSLGSVRRRYPASDRISAADSESAPLLGTATRNMGSLQLPVDVVEGQSAGDHQHLGPAQQLTDLRGERRRTPCSAASHTSPALRGSSCRGCARRRPTPRPWHCWLVGAGPPAEFGEQFLEGLHGLGLFRMRHLKPKQNPETGDLMSSGLPEPTSRSYARNLPGGRSPWTSRSGDDRNHVCPCG